MRQIEENQSVDISINPEYFYFAYNKMSQCVKDIDDFCDAINSVSETKLNSIDCSFSQIKSVTKEMNSSLNSLYNKMKIFKSELEKDASNSQLFDFYDFQMSDTFGDDMSKEDEEKYYQKIKNIYSTAKDKPYEQLNTVEKWAIDNYEKLKEEREIRNALDEYNRLERTYNYLNELSNQRATLGSQLIYHVTGYGEVAEGHEEEYEEINRQILILDNKIDETYKVYNATRKEELRKKLVKAGVLDENWHESLLSAGKKLYESASDISEVIISEGQKAGAAIKNGENIIDVVKNIDYKAIGKETIEFVTETTATGAVIQKKFESGLLKFGEAIVDGSVLLTTVPVFALNGLNIAANNIFFDGSDEKFESNPVYSAVKFTSDKIMDAIAYDVVGSEDKYFFENTKLGSLINDTSALKYDSAGAMLFRDAGLKTSEIAVAVCASIFTCGAAAPLIAAGVGFVEGTGLGAEEQFSKTDVAGNYTGRNGTGALLIGGRALGKASELYSYASMASGVVGTVKQFGSVKSAFPALKNGITQQFSNLGYNAKGLRGELLVKTLLNLAKQPDLYIDSGAIICNGAAKGLSTGEWDSKEVILGLVLVVGGNIFGSYVSAKNELISEYGAKYLVYNLDGKNKEHRAAMYEFLSQKFKETHKGEDFYDFLKRHGINASNEDETVDILVELFNKNTKSNVTVVGPNGGSVYGIKAEYSIIGNEFGTNYYDPYFKSNNTIGLKNIPDGSSIDIEWKDIQSFFGDDESAKYLTYLSSNYSTIKRSGYNGTTIFYANDTIDLTRLSGSELTARLNMDGTFIDMDDMVFLVRDVDGINSAKIEKWKFDSTNPGKIIVNDISYDYDIIDILDINGKMTSQKCIVDIDGTQYMFVPGFMGKGR